MTQWWSPPPHTRNMEVQQHINRSCCPFSPSSTQQRRHQPRQSSSITAAATRQPDSLQLQAFPSEYDTALRQATLATKAALADGHKLLEIEFPVTGLTAAQGDGDGQSEMNSSMNYLRRFLNGFGEQAASTRVFFPDNIELAVARGGQTADPAAGRQEMAAVFESDAFQYGYLTKQSAAWAVLGVNFGNRFQPSSLAKDTDSLYVVAYPSFNPREELTAARELWDNAASPRGKPLIIFNGELDRLRGGYYPSLFFPELAKLTDELLPQVECAFYIHNFKGSRPGALFRAYPGPWQVLRRSPIDPEQTVCVWSSQERPSLKQVALEILPNS